MSTTLPILHTLRSREIREIFSRNNIRHVYLTGSFARWEETDESDLDIIYEKLPDVRFTLMNIGDMKMSLEDKLQREVDLIPMTAIRSDIRDSVLADRVLVL